MNPLEHLKAALERLNPAIEMRRKLVEEGHLDPKRLLLMASDITKSIEEGTKEIRRGHQALSALKGSDPTTSTNVPTGF